MHQKKPIAMIIFIHLRNGNYQMNFIRHVKKERFILSFLHNFTTSRLHAFTPKEYRNFSFPTLPSTPLLDLQKKK